MKYLLGFVVAVSFSNAYAAAWQPAEGHQQVPIWPGMVPDAKSSTGPEGEMTLREGKLIAGRPWLEVQNVTRPTMTVYSPTVSNNGAAVIVFPGGGYRVLAIDLEGTEVCDWVIKADAESCRPDFAVSLYPGHMSVNYRDDLSKLNPTIKVTSRTPPTLLIHAQDDPVDPVEFSLLYHAALKKANVPVEMHLFAQGGHAFGLRPTKLPITKWPALVETWLGTIGMIPEK